MGRRKASDDLDDDEVSVSFEEAGVNLDDYYAANPDKRPPEALVLRELAKMQARFAARQAPITTQGDLFA